MERFEAVELEISGEVPAGSVRRSGRTRAVAALFDLPMRSDSGVRRLFAPFTLAVRAGTVTLITGPSGSGKSTILAGIAAGLRTPAAMRGGEHEGKRGRIQVMRLEEIELAADAAVVDCFASPLDQTLGHLARAGLSEAHILLRAPAELSDGQRFRYRLARFFASSADVLLADEFAATLDRVTAKVAAYRLGKFIRATGKAAIVATTHEDLAEDLAAEVVVYKGLGEDEIRMTNDE